MENPRRRRLLAWFKGPPCKGVQEELVKRSGLTKGRISQILDDKQAFGERSARALAERLELAPDFFESDAPGVAAEPAPKPTPMTDEELVERLRPEWRELILAYELLMDSDRAAMIDPILKKADELRRHWQAMMDKHGVSDRPLRTTGNNLPVAPPYSDKERRAHPHASDTDFVQSPLTHNEQNPGRKRRKS